MDLYNTGSNAFVSRDLLSVQLGMMHHSLFSRMLRRLYQRCGRMLAPGRQALFLYRISHICFQSKYGYGLAMLIWRFNLFLTGADIHPRAKLAKSVKIHHTVGIVIGCSAEIHEDVIILHGVTIGARRYGTPGRQHATIEHGAILGAGCAILGNITIGAGAKIGANVTVTNSVPSNATVVSPEARTMLPD